MKRLGFLAVACIVGAFVYLFGVLPRMAPVSGDWDRPRRSFVSETAFPSANVAEFVRGEPISSIGEIGAIEWGGGCEAVVPGKVGGAHNLVFGRNGTSILDVVGHIGRAPWMVYDLVVGKRCEDVEMPPAPVAGFVSLSVAPRPAYFGMDLEVKDEKKDGRGDIWLDGRREAGEVDLDVLEVVRGSLGAGLKMGTCDGSHGGGWEWICEVLGVCGEERARLLARSIDVALRRSLSAVGKVFSGGFVEDGDVVRICVEGGWKNIRLDRLTAGMKAHSFLEERPHAGMRHWSVIEEDGRYPVFIVGQAELWIVALLLWIPAAIATAYPEGGVLLGSASCSCFLMSWIWVMGVESVRSGLLFGGLFSGVVVFVWRRLWMLELEKYEDRLMAYLVDVDPKQLYKSSPFPTPSTIGEEGPWQDQVAIDAAEAVSEAFSLAGELTGDRDADDRLGTLTPDTNQTLLKPKSIHRPYPPIPELLITSTTQTILVALLEAVRGTFITLGLLGTLFSAIDPLASIGIFSLLWSPP